MHITDSSSEAYYVWRRGILPMDIIQPGIADDVVDVAQAHMRPVPGQYRLSVLRAG
ncbi:MAG: hypothetical protein AW07_03401 [Candidatus Accumulibacter sp. SK-11]|nr:MAG: hypothetical protein AW07_03401 [Candidatus Accumulibacter sp. SK-11]